MKNVPFYILLIVALTFACKPKGNLSVVEEKIEQDSIAKVEKKIVKEKDQILSGYYELKDALVATDSKLAQEKAGLLAKALKEKGTTGEVLLMTQAIAGAKDVKDQRIAFEKLSREIYAMAKKSIFSDSVIYRLYCPMAFNNEGAFWLSKEEEINNPYFGDKMLKCGRVEEKILK